MVCLETLKLKFCFEICARSEVGTQKRTNGVFEVWGFEENVLSSISLSWLTYTIGIIISYNL